MGIINTEFVKKKEKKKNNKNSHFQSIKETMNKLILLLKSS